MSNATATFRGYFSVLIVSTPLLEQSHQSLTLSSSRFLALFRDLSRIKFSLSLSLSCSLQIVSRSEWLTHRVPVTARQLQQPLLQHLQHNGTAGTGAQVGRGPLLSIMRQGDSFRSLFFLLYFANKNPKSDDMVVLSIRQMECHKG